MAIKTLEEFTVEAQAEIDSQKTANGGNGLFVQFDDVKREYTDTEYEQAETDLAKLKLKEQDYGWIKNRQAEYPSLQDCIHALLDGGDTLTDLQAARQAVKDAYPKPGE